MQVSSKSRKRSEEVEITRIQVDITLNSDGSAVTTLKVTDSVTNVTDIHQGSASRDDIMSGEFFRRNLAEVTGAEAKDPRQKAVNLEQEQILKAIMFGFNHNASDTVGAKVAKSMASVAMLADVITTDSFEKTANAMLPLVDAYVGHLVQEALQKGKDEQMETAQRLVQAGRQDVPGMHAKISELEQTNVMLAAALAAEKAQNAALIERGNALLQTHCTLQTTHTQTASELAQYKSLVNQFQLLMPGGAQQQGSIQALQAAGQQQSAAQGYPHSGLQAYLGAPAAQPAITSPAQVPFHFGTETSMVRYSGPQ